MALLKYLQQEGPVCECCALSLKGDRADERVREASSCAQRRAGECEARSEAQCYEMPCARHCADDSPLHP